MLPTATVFQKFLNLEEVVIMVEPRAREQRNRNLHGSFAFASVQKSKVLPFLITINAKYFTLQCLQVLQNHTLTASQSLFVAVNSMPAAKLSC